MIRVFYEKNSYFLGENGIYLELHNTKEFKDQDGIKRIVVEINRVLERNRSGWR